MLHYNLLLYMEHCSIFRLINSCILFCIMKLDNNVWSDVNEGITWIGQRGHSTISIKMEPLNPSSKDKSFDLSRRGTGPAWSFIDCISLYISLYAGRWYSSMLYHIRRESILLIIYNVTTVLTFLNDKIELQNRWLNTTINYTSFSYGS